MTAKTSAAAKTEDASEKTIEQMRADRLAARAAAAVEDAALDLPLLEKNVVNAQICADAAAEIVSTIQHLMVRVTPDEQSLQLFAGQLNIAAMNVNVIAKSMKTHAEQQIAAAAKKQEG